ncbi:MAG: hypothetical protein AABW99_01910 [archaeon]
MPFFGNLFGVFTGSKPVEKIVFDRPSMKSAAISYAAVFAIVSLLLIVESALFLLASSILSSVDAVQAIVSVLIFCAVAVILAVVVLVFKFAFAYVWASLHFFLASFFSKRSYNLSDFNAIAITLFSSVNIVSGLLLLIPVIGWIAAVAVQFYGAALLRRAVRNYFGVSADQASIIVLVFLNLAMLVFVIIAAIASFVLIGSKIL